MKHLPLITVVIPLYNGAQYIRRSVQSVLEQSYTDFAGPEFSSIAAWVREFDIGLVLTGENFKTVVQELLKISQNPDVLESWQKNAIQTYQNHFSKTRVMDAWNSALHDVLKNGFQTTSSNASVITKARLSRTKTHAGG